MKNLHFCTPELLKIIKDPKKKVFYTYRTGFVPSIYPGDIININERDSEGKDIFIMKALVESVNVLRLVQLHDSMKSIYGCPTEELKRYGKKFHRDHWFFSICIRKQWKDILEYSRFLSSEGGGVGNEV